MTDDKDETSREHHAARRRSRHGFWTGIVAGALLGAVVSGAVGALAAGHLGGGHGRRGFLRGQDPEAAREHVELAADWILSRVDATEEQKGEAKRVVGEAFDDLLPLVDEHRAGHARLISELTRTEVDGEAIERLRQSQVELLDRASKELTQSLTELAGILTPEQRADLVELAGRVHH